MLPLCSLLGAHRIIGTAGINKGLDALLTDPMPSTEDHAIIRRLKLIEHMGAKRHTEQLSFFLQPEERTLLPKTKPRIVLHPGSKDSFRRWPLEHFIQTGKALTQFGAEIWVTGTTSEMALIQQITNSIPGAILGDPTLTVRQFAAQLEHFDLLITNDTGPVHLASALHIPVIAIYSPSDPAHFGPLNVERALAIAKPPTCEPCLKRRCHRPFCFLQIGPEEVAAHAKKMLKQWAERPNATNNSKISPNWISKF
jgi:ADP-heptose:LPS heptosyltransferase